MDAPDRGVPEWVSAFVMALPDAASVVDETLRVWCFNPAYAQLTGMNRRARRSAPSVGLCHAHFQLASCTQEGGCLSRRALAAGRSLHLVEVQGADDTYRFNVTAIPVLPPHAPSPWVVEVYRDVGSESRMQEHYQVLLADARRQSDRLEEEVRARTAELAHNLDTLRVAQAALVQSEKQASLGTLVAGISHELNNPLSFVQSGARSLQDFLGDVRAASEEALQLLAGGAPVELKRRLDESLREVHDIAKEMNEGTSRLQRIVQELRNLTSPAADEPRALDMRVEVERAWSRVRERCPRPPRLQLGEMQAVHAAPQLFAQALYHLVLNAAQAAGPQGEVRVTSELFGEQVLLLVSDTGPGVPTQHVLRVFDPFFTTRPPGEGVGMGLTVALRMATAMGGTVELLQREGPTLFALRLPKTPVKKAADSYNTLRANP